MAIKVKLVSLLILSAALMTWSGCSGDGSTLGPDGTPAAMDDDGPDDDNGDTNGDDGDSGPTVTLTQLKTDVFSVRCGACHLGSAPSGNMSLAADFIYADVFDVSAVGNSNFKRIAPGDPDNSYIVMKLRGDSRIVGGQMPLDGTAPIPEEDIAKVATWIEEGALDN